MPGATYAPQNRNHLCSLSHKVNCAAREGALGHSPRYEPLSPTGSLKIALNNPGKTDAGRQSTQQHYQNMLLF
jgi:hypothetical protein